MSLEDIMWILLVAALLVGGYLVGQRVVAPTGPSAPGAFPLTDGSFRQWFWQNRSLDLAAQVGLIFVGALGIAALLPGNEEEETG